MRYRIEALLRRPASRQWQHRTDGGDTGAGRAGAGAAEPDPGFTAQAGSLTYQGMVVSEQDRTVGRTGEQVHLTRSEFILLQALLRSAPRTVSTGDLIQTLHDEEPKQAPSRSTHDAQAIHVHISNLRRKLGPPSSHGQRIETIRGAGYRIRAA
ncbi:MULTISPECIES: helix-turn-helix domain-containing protein [Paenarthrobacter]|uniref:winged helix-turn-helix domain-containing protein n=1 Tax=Paenarthrobacter TaxID=1742992 RepID=UPI000FEC40CB|nr:helix-turn-helix domain-containing protein [Paenarthrobacter ureafaciens]RWW91433.1 winged helix family transcriptional regulator [Paenarthrobacter ureafaciens]